MEIKSVTKNYNYEKFNKNYICDISGVVLRG